MKFKLLLLLSATAFWFAHAPPTVGTANAATYNLSYDGSHSSLGAGYYSPSIINDTGNLGSLITLFDGDVLNVAFQDVPMLPTPPDSFLATLLVLNNSAPSGAQIQESSFGPTRLMSVANGNTLLESYYYSTQYEYEYLTSVLLTFVVLSGVPLNSGGLSVARIEAVHYALAETPVPSTLPLFATGLGVLGLLGWRRKRKAAQVDLA
jgi:hypothetical protein